jgi:hypothetical protein
MHAPPRALRARGCALADPAPRIARAIRRGASRPAQRGALTGRTRARCGRSRTRTRWARWRCRGRRPRRPARSSLPRGPGSPSGALRPLAATTPSRCLPGAALRRPRPLWPAAGFPCAAPPRICVTGWSKLARWCGRARGHVPGAALVQRAAQRFRMCSAAPSRPPLPTPAQAPACCCRTSG